MKIEERTPKRLPAAKTWFLTLLFSSSFFSFFFSSFGSLVMREIG
jgi:hypothetical protein